MRVHLKIACSIMFILQGNIYYYHNLKKNGERFKEINTEFQEKYIKQLLWFL